MKEHIVKVLEVNMIDFRRNGDEMAVVQFGETIAGYDPEIRPRHDGFRVKIGCQAIEITPANIDAILAEANGTAPKMRTVQLILPKGCTKQYKAYTNIPKLAEEARGYYISETKKAYPKADFELREVQIPIENTYLTRKRDQLFWKNSSLYTEDTPKVLHILNTMKAYFAKV